MIRYKVKPKSKIKLSDFDPDDKSYFDLNKREGKRELLKLNLQMDGLQELLYAEHKHKVLIILQATDTGGKDGVIRNVFEGVNPQGVRVAPFKVPTPLELDHDYLWRVHRQVPGRGEIVIFNRSHYEDVLVVRVHQLAPKSVWNKRYDQINAFEKMLHEEGTSIVKFFLHISFEEQRQRLLDRIKEADKNWKFNPGDLKERELWTEYTAAFEDVLSKTSTSWAPWYVIPSNRKWYRNLVISKILVDLLENLKMKFPEPEEDLNTYKAQLESRDPLRSGAADNS